VSLLFGKKARRGATLGVAGLGACALLAACSPVQLGAAAIAGNQRITVSSLDSNVSTLQASTTHYASPLNTLRGEVEQEQEELPIDATPLPQLVLNWQLTFAIASRVAAADGISVSQEQGQAALAADAKQLGVTENVFLTALGIPLTMTQQAEQYFGQEAAFSKKYGSNTTAYEKSECTAAKSLNIQVNPQFGRFDYAPTSLSLVPGNDTLSRPAGTPSPADTEGLTPAAC
jgi:hypothetical protein